MSSDAGRPVVRVLHQAARTGGTVISRCLGAMPGVVLLSEIHPAGTDVYDPLQQAAEWYGLLEPGEPSRVTGDFPAAIDRVARRCRERDLQLVLRDWSHLDFYGAPFTRPAGRSLLVASLQDRFTLRRFATVRHPFDQWLSMGRQQVLVPHLKQEPFLAGALAFARMAEETGFVRYEDFTRDPDDALQTICAALRLPYDGGWRGRWSGNTRVTGDLGGSRGGLERIAAPPRRETRGDYADRFLAHPRCRDICRRLGYDEASL